MRFFIPAVLAVLFTSSVALPEPPRFEPNDIGSLAGHGTYAMALNDIGQVVGYSLMGTPPPHSEPPANAFLYSNGVMRDLFDGETGAVSVATAVNQAGEVVGYRRWALMGPAQPFYYSDATGVSLLNPFGAIPLVATGAAYGINASGEMVGSAFKPGAGSRAFSMASFSNPGVDLTPALSAPYFGSQASAVNDAGQIVVVLGKPGRHPFYDATDSFLLDGLMSTNLDELLTQDPAFSGASFEPKAINAVGVIAGYVYGAGRSVQAFVYDNGTFVDLGALSGGSSWGYGIDTAGRVVGDATLADGSTRHAFLWEEGVMYDLNDYVDPSLGIVLTGGRAINDLGQIVVWGYETSEPGPTRITHSYLLKPFEASGAIEDLIDFIEGLGLQRGIENSLIVKLDHALAALEEGDTGRACSLLGAFINEVEAQAGKKISVADAATLINEATSVRDMRGCS